MATGPPLPDKPLTPEHARQLDILLATLSTDEALWISGYLAGFARHDRPAESTVAISNAIPLHILYGSETGHAEALAQHAEELAQAGGMAVRRIDLADFRPQEIREVRQLLIFISTHGDGDPPLTATDFCEFLQSRKAPRLDGLKYAVLGLGDSSYAQFCQTGKTLDQRLEALGAQRIYARADCDVDFEVPAAAWTAGALAAFANEAPTGKAMPVLSAGVATTVQPVDEKHPFAATVLENLILNGRGSAKETRHIELSLAGSGLNWVPGDSLGVLPENDPVLIAELIDRLWLEANEPVPGSTSFGTLPLAEAMSKYYEITTLTPGFIARYAEAASAKKLLALATPGEEAELRRYMADRQIIDVISEFPMRGVSGKDFIAMLRPLQPRLYSLASSPAAFPDEVHLTVAVVRYTSHGRPRSGVASGSFAERCKIDDTVSVHVSSNKNFRLPADPATPIIMIGPGTGVAPFRAFLQEREATGAPGRNWLFFGEQHFRTDFLYQTEWQRLLKSARLTRMDIAFSRDQEEKIYVQHRLLEHSHDIYAWLEEGASLYVCGDASHMAPDVHAALLGIIAKEGQQSQEQAKAYLHRLQQEKRYQRDVY